MKKPTKNPRKKILKTTSSGPSCKRCGAKVEGQAQVCDGCRAAKLLCKSCGKPHGGPPATTRFCPPCRATRRRRHTLKYNPFTEREDEIIRDAYASFHARAAVEHLKKKLPGRPRWSITRRAAVLGAATIRRKEPPWSAAEDVLLRELGWMMPERIVVIFRQKGFHRTLTAIAVRRKRMRVNESIDGMTAQALSQMLNVDVKTVTRWIAMGKLKAERAGTTGDNHDRYHITTAQIRAFFLAHPEDIELSKLERVGSKMWFLELLTGGQILEHGQPGGEVSALPAPPERRVCLYGEHLSLSALAEISGRSTGDLLARIDGEGRSVEDAAFGADGTVPELPAGPMTEMVAESLGQLLGRHRARPEDVARWTSLPFEIVARCLRGTVPLQAPAMERLVGILDAELLVAIEPKKHAYDAAPVRAKRG